MSVKRQAAVHGGGATAGQLIVWGLRTFAGVEMPVELAVLLGQGLGTALGWAARRVDICLEERSWTNEIDDIDFDGAG